MNTTSSTDDYKSKVFDSYWLWRNVLSMQSPHTYHSSYKYAFQMGTFSSTDNRDSCSYRKKGTRLLYKGFNEKQEVTLGDGQVAGTGGGSVWQWWELEEGELAEVPEAATGKDAGDICIQAKGGRLAKGRWRVKTWTCAGVRSCLLACG